MELNTATGMSPRNTRGVQSVSRASGWLNRARPGLDALVVRLRDDGGRTTRSRSKVSPHAVASRLDHRAHEWSQGLVGRWRNESNGLGRQPSVIPPLVGKYMAPTLPPETALQESLSEAAERVAMAAGADPRGPGQSADAWIPPPEAVTATSVLPQLADGMLPLPRRRRAGPGPGHDTVRFTFLDLLGLRGGRGPTWLPGDRVQRAGTRLPGPQVEVVIGAVELIQHVDEENDEEAAGNVIPIQGKGQPTAKK